MAGGGEADFPKLQRWRWGNDMTVRPTLTENTACVEMIKYVHVLVITSVLEKICAYTANLRLKKHFKRSVFWAWWRNIDISHFITIIQMFIDKIYDVSVQSPMTYTQHCAWTPRAHTASPVWTQCERTLSEMFIYTMDCRKNSSYQAIYHQQISVKHLQYNVRVASTVVLYCHSLLVHGGTIRAKHRMETTIVYWLYIVNSHTRLVSLKHQQSEWREFPPAWVHSMQVKLKFKLIYQ